MVRTSIKCVLDSTIYMHFYENQISPNEEYRRFVLNKTMNFPWVWIFSAILNLMISECFKKNITIV